MARRHQDKNQNNQGDTNADVNALPRVVMAMRLRRLGHTYEDIATACGYCNASAARKAILQAESKIIRDEGRALMMRQADYIDVALKVVLEAIERNDKQSLWAVDRLVPLLKRQAELLGLDAKSELPAGATLVREIGAPLGEL